LLNTKKKLKEEDLKFLPMVNGEQFAIKILEKLRPLLLVIKWAFPEVKILEEKLSLEESMFVKTIWELIFVEKIHYLFIENLVHVKEKKPLLNSAI